LLICFYISAHGFGHAFRDIELIDAIASKHREAHFIVRTAAPHWLFDSANTDLDVQSVDTDPGFVQIDSLRLDIDETARRSALFYRSFGARVDHEAEWLRTARIGLVLGDIPPLAFAAAARAGVPSVAIGNFTWDWIYGIYPVFTELAPDVIPTMRQAYAEATRALRLPFHGGFEPMAAKTRDIPLIARRSELNRDETRRRLGVSRDKPIVLTSFGAYGVELPYERLRQSDAFTLVSVARPPEGLKYQDMVAAADVVVSKPGYGIVSECIANGTALLYTSRGEFIEYDVFVAEMPRLLRCRHMSQDQLFGGRWEEAIDALLRQPEPPDQPRIDGAKVAADEIINLVIGSSGNR
jgi:hypothetical protein